MLAIVGMVTLVKAEVHVASFGGWEPGGGAKHAFRDFVGCCCIPWGIRSYSRHIAGTACDGNATLTFDLGLGNRR